MSNWVWIRGKRIADEDAHRHCVDLDKAVAVTVFGEPQADTPSRVRIDFATNLVFWCEGESADLVTKAVDEMRRSYSTA